MNKKEIYNYLKENNIWYEITEHKAVYNMNELFSLELPYENADAKNLFLCDDKKRNYYLITVKGDKKIDLKTFRKNNHTRPLSFASEEDLMSLLHLLPGSVTPFGLLNDNDLQVQLYIDSYFTKNSKLIGVHPNDNTATVWLKTEDLIKIIEEHGNQVNVIDI